MNKEAVLTSLAVILFSTNMGANASMVEYKIQATATGTGPTTQNFAPPPSTTVNASSSAKTNTTSIPAVNIPMPTAYFAGSDSSAAPIPVNFNITPPVKTPAIAAEKPAEIQKPIKEVDYIETKNAANASVKFMYYIPASLVKSKEAYPVIIWVPGLDEDGEETLNGKFLSFADEKGFAILTPTFKFNQEDFDKEKAYQYPSAWSADALMSMLEKAKEKGLNYSKLYLVGFSAGAQFSSRFSFLKPDVVEACALLASGARVKPEKKTNVKYFVGIGTQDTEFRLKNAEIFKTAAESLEIPVVYKEYNTDHSMPEEQATDVMKFFEDVRKGNI